MAIAAFRFTLEARTEDRGMSAQAQDRPVPAWRKGSGSDTANCVEVAVCDSWVLVRDSRDPDQVILPVAAGSWRQFVSRIKVTGI